MTEFVQALNNLTWPGAVVLVAMFVAVAVIIVSFFRNA